MQQNPRGFSLSNYVQIIAFLSSVDIASEESRAEEPMRKMRKAYRGLLALCFVCATPTFAQRCGVERWSVKTGVDSDSIHVDVSNPQTASVAELIAFQAPSPLLKDTRFAP